MSHKASFFMSLLVSVVFLGGVTISENSLAQSPSNNTQTNKQDIYPGGANSEQQNSNIHNQQYVSPGGVNTDQNNSTKQDKKYMTPGGVNADQQNDMQNQRMSPGGVNADQQKNMQNQGHMSSGGVKADQKNSTMQNKKHMGGANADQQNSTKQGKGYMSPGGVTADQQGESQQDRELTQKIRQAVMKDKDLSMNAHNVKIITVDGVVTLKGPVASEQEKKAIEELATEAAGKDKIKSEITIAP